VLKIVSSTVDDWTLDQATQARTSIAVAAPKAAKTRKRSATAPVTSLWLEVMRGLPVSSPVRDVAAEVPAGA
jgi:hypothetical protein